MGNGFIIETSGTPPPRLPEEFQPILIADGNGQTVTPPVEPAPTPSPAPQYTAEAPKVPRQDYGLGKRH